MRTHFLQPVIARSPLGVRGNLVEETTAVRCYRFYADEIATLRSQ